MTARLSSLIGLLLGLLFLWAATRAISIAELAATMRRGSPPMLGAAAAAFWLFVLVKSLRWQFLLGPLESLRTKQLLPPVIIGLAGNLLIPHSGEIARAYLVSRCARNAPVSALLGTIAAERMLDFLAIPVLLGAATALERPPAPMLLGVSYTFAAIATLIALFIGVLLRWSEGTLRAIERLTSPLPARWRTFITGEVRKALHGFAVIRSPHRLGIATVLSVLQWLSMATVVYFAVRSFGAEAPWAASTLVLALTVIGLTAPTAPGYVGTIQLAFIVGLAEYGIAESGALAASISFNVIVTVPVLLVTLPLMHRLGYRFRSVGDPPAA